MSRPPLDPTMAAGHEIAKGLGLDLPAIAQLIDALDAADRRPSKALTRAEADSLGMCVADIRDIQERLARGGAMKAVRAGIARMRELSPPPKRVAAPIASSPVLADSAQSDIVLGDGASNLLPWQKEVQTIAQLHGFENCTVALGGGKREAYAHARWDMFAHLLNRGWSKKGIGDNFAHKDHTTIMYGIAKQKAFGLQVQAMEELMGPAFVPHSARSLPEASLVMFKAKQLLPRFEEMEEVMQDVPMPQSMDDCFADVDGKRVLTPQGRKFATTGIRVGLDALSRM